MIIKHLEVNPSENNNDVLQEILNALNGIAAQLEKIIPPEPTANSIPSDNVSKSSDEIITVKEAAKIMRISLPKMYEFAESGKIRSIRVGRRVLVSRSSLTEFISGKITQ